MSGAELATLNRVLAGGVRLQRFVLDAKEGRFDTSLTLQDRAGALHELVCHDVQHLELLPEGDALDGSLRLAVEDLRGDGLDRIGFSLEELDSDLLFLHCAQLALTQGNR